MKRKRGIREGDMVMEARTETCSTADFEDVGMGP